MWPSYNLGRTAGKLTIYKSVYTRERRHQLSFKTSKESKVKTQALRFKLYTGDSSIYAGKRSPTNHMVLNDNRHNKHREAPGYARPHCLPTRPGANKETEEGKTLRTSPAENLTQR